MTDKQFLNKLKEVGFTPTFYIDSYHNYDTDNNMLVHDMEYQTIIEGLEAEIDLARMRDQYEARTEAQDKLHEILQEANRHTLGDLFEYEVVDTYGGGEGDGEHFHVVLHFTKVDKYAKAEAYYYSYDGISNFDDEWTLVEPTEVIVIQYTPKEINEHD